MKTKITKLTLISLALLSPLVPLWGYSFFLGGAYIGFWIIMTALAARIVFSDEIKQH